MYPPGVRYPQMDLFPYLNHAASPPTPTAPDTAHGAAPAAIWRHT